MMQQKFGGVCVMAGSVLVFVWAMMGVIFGESGNATIAGFAAMFASGTLAGWTMDRVTQGRWQLYRSVKDWHAPFILELGLIIAGAVWYFGDVAFLMRGEHFDVTIQRVVVWLLLTVGMGASLSRAIEDKSHRKGLRPET
jgi:small-conductance mechanosensitive channel